MSSNGNGETGSSGEDWGEARDRFDVVRDTRDMEVNPAAPVDTFQDVHLATNRSSLPGAVAADIAFNPFSTYGTQSEKAMAGAQTILPGGLAIGAIRAASMTGGSVRGTGPDAPPGPKGPAEPGTLLRKRSKPGGAAQTKRAAPRGGVTPNPVIRPAPSPARTSPTRGSRGILTSAYGDITAPNVARKNLLGA